MSELKKQLYKRETAADAAESLIDRIEAINNGTADYKYYNRIESVILFGSFVNNDKPRIHDLDVLVIHDDDRVLMGKFHAEHVGLFYDFVEDLYSEALMKERYLRNRRNIYSIHSNIHEKKHEILNIATSDKHIFICRNHKICEDARFLIASCRNASQRKGV